MDIPRRAECLLRSSSLEVCPCYNLDRNGFEQQDLNLETPKDPAQSFCQGFGCYQTILTGRYFSQVV